MLESFCGLLVGALSSLVCCDFFVYRCDTMYVALFVLLNDKDDDTKHDDGTINSRKRKKENPI
jgi:hypothetical protein